MTRLADTVRSFRRPERWAAVLGPDPDAVVARALTRRSYGVRRAADTLDLLTRCAAERLEIVVLASGVEDAVDACRQLRTSPHATGTFIVAVVGDRPAPADLDALQSAGANDFVLGTPTAEALDVRLRIADAWLAQRGSRRRAESQSRLEVAKFRAVFEGTHDGLLLIDDEGRIADCNGPAATIFGRERAGLTGAMLVDAVGGTKLATQSVPSGSDAAAAWKRLRERGEQAGAFQLQLLDGRRREIEYQAKAGILPGLDLLVLRDVTDQRRVRDQLIVADRLASLGAVASGVGHEINNPLATLVANTEYFQSVLAGPITDAVLGELRTAVGDTAEAVQRLRAISHDLRSFAHPDGDAPRALDVALVVDTAIRIASHEVQRKARLVRSFGEVPRVRAAEGKLGHVVLHLLLLAASTIPAGRQQQNEIKITVRSENGRVLIEVRDTGPGIPAGSLPSGLDALSTTPPAQGPDSRVGLFVVKSMVESLGGEIAFENAATGGMAYRVALPQAA